MYHDHTRDTRTTLYGNGAKLLLLGSVGFGHTRTRTTRDTPPHATHVHSTERDREVSSFKVNLEISR